MKEAEATNRKNFGFVEGRTFNPNTNINNNNSSNGNGKRRRLVAESSSSDSEPQQVNKRGSMVSDAAGQTVVACGLLVAACDADRKRNVVVAADGFCKSDSDAVCVGCDSDVVCTDDVVMWNGARPRSPFVYNGLKPHHAAALSESEGGVEIEVGPLRKPLSPPRVAQHTVETRAPKDDSDPESEGEGDRQQSPVFVRRRQLARRDSNNNNNYDNNKHNIDSEPDMGDVSDIAPSCLPSAAEESESDTDDEPTTTTTTTNNTDSDNNNNNNLALLASAAEAHRLFTNQPSLHDDVDVGVGLCVGSEVARTLDVNVGGDVDVDVGGDKGVVVGVSVVVGAGETLALGQTQPQPQPQPQPSALEVCQCHCVVPCNCNLDEWGWDNFNKEEVGLVATGASNPFAGDGRLKFSDPTRHRCTGDCDRNKCVHRPFYNVDRFAGDKPPSFDVAAVTRDRELAYDCAASPSHARARALSLTRSRSRSSVSDNEDVDQAGDDRSGVLLLLARLTATLVSHKTLVTEVRAQIAQLRSHRTDANQRPTDTLITHLSALTAQYKAQFAETRKHITLIKAAHASLLRAPLTQDVNVDNVGVGGEVDVDVDVPTRVTRRSTHKRAAPARAGLSRAVKK